MLFVARLDAHENSDGLCCGGLFDGYPLEAPLQSGIALYVFAVVVHGGRADALELAAGERRLEYVGSVHGALSGSGADHSVYLVDEEDAVARILDFVDHLLEALFELSAVFGASNQGTHV